MDNSEFLADLKIIKDIDDDAFNQTLKVLSEQGVDSADWVLSLTTLSRDYGENVKALLRFLEFLSGNFVNSRNYDERVVFINKFFRNVTLDDEDALKGWEKISSKLNSMHDYFLSKKEEEIKDRFSRISRFNVTTDIRPIFNMNKSKIEKNIYPNILKIETVDDKTFICEFYEDTLDKLIEELTSAKEKLKIINKT